VKGEYTVKYDTKTGIELKKIPIKIAQRIFKKIRKSKSNPYRYWIKLDGRPDYRIRVGDYRAIADIHADEKLIFVTKVGHRSKIYEKI
jgi:mRNA interferase RelE/StbE